jgi:hypothetical protein
MIKGEHRKTLVDNGFYDGRFAPKVIPNKKKKADKEACRKYGR